MNDAMNGADDHTQAPPQQPAENPLTEAYRKIINNAAILSQLAPVELRHQAFAEILRHILENERMIFMMQQQAAAQPPRRSPLEIRH